MPIFEGLLYALLLVAQIDNVQQIFPNKWSLFPPPSFSFPMIERFWSIFFSKIRNRLSDQGMESVARYLLFIYLYQLIWKESDANYLIKAILKFLGSLEEPSAAYGVFLTFSKNWDQMVQQKWKDRYPTLLIIIFSVVKMRKGSSLFLWRNFLFFHLSGVLLLLVLFPSREKLTKNPLNCGNSMCCCMLHENPLRENSFLLKRLQKLNIYTSLKLHLVLKRTQIEFINYIQPSITDGSFIIFYANVNVISTASEYSTTYVDSEN